MASANPWAWLGLLKWSLSYSDGTRDSSDMVPMSPEDKAFLETVMKEGIIDEGERMKFILKQAAEAMEYYQQQSETNQEQEPPISEEALEDLLQELRDIVEQIDFARSFCALKGLPFLLGCVQETAVPEAIRQICMGILATLCQNNPPVQKELLELGAIKTLSDLFVSDTSVSMKARIMQAMSSCVRNDQVGENVFCQLPQAPSLMTAGLDPTTSSPQLQTRTLFFLRALITSDHAAPSHVRTFADAIGLIADHYLNKDVSSELREMSVALLVQVLEQKKSVNSILQRKDGLAALGVQRISALRALTGEERELTQLELEHWENFLVLLARATPDPPIMEDTVKELEAVQEGEETTEEPLALKM